MTYREWQAECDRTFAYHKRSARCIFLNEALMRESFDQGISPAAFAKSIPDQGVESSKAISGIRSLSIVTLILLAAWWLWVGYHWAEYQTARAKLERAVEDLRGR